MKVLSLKLKEDIFNEVEKIVQEIQISRNAYINRALELYNKLNQRKSLKKQLEKESKAVKDISLSILSEFEKLEDELS
ncbi:MAG: hypothetical protein A3D92_13465 [Bacteroidetes bacterium RIFCSPHIGHO2_02_FULL_44_7]|nr:MAG: hypothetical protein A3D92_13465 [Bacteroidetes bacterium RIFCSPHIGHO2_02_FULL_44_7]